MALLLPIDRESPTPVWQQIRDRVVHLVEEGTLRTGHRLPPTRTLAGSLGVNRSTVYRAYQELWALGYLESRPGSYSTVRGRLRTAGSQSPGTTPGLDWDALVTPLAWQHYHASLAMPSMRGHGMRFDFATLSPDYDCCPADDLRQAVKRAMIAQGPSVLDYGDPAGYRELRERVAERMRVHGVNVTADEILLTAGAQQALDLVTRLLGRPGTGVAVEAPTYPLAPPLFRLHGLAVHDVAMRPDGLDLDRLEDVVGREPVAFIYTMPNFQNPTGVTTSQAHRERLLMLCERHGVPLVEDGFEEEMKYFGKAVLPVKSIDVHGVVVYIGTFSKVLFPGLRVGWIAADRECIARLAAIVHTTALSGNVLAQAALARFCQSGCYDTHLRRLHATYRRRMHAMLRGLRSALPARDVEWTEPDGGYTVWLRFRGHSARLESRLRELAAAEQIALVPGSACFSQPPDCLSCRLSIARVAEEDIAEGCRRLGRVVERLAEA